MTTTSDSSVIHLRPRKRPETVLLTKKEAAERLRVSTRTIERWMERGIVPYVYLDDNPQLLRFPVDRLDEWWSRRVVAR